MKIKLLPLAAAALLLAMGASLALPQQPANPSAAPAGTAEAAKTAPQLTQGEALLFEKSSPGKCAYKLPPLDVPAVDAVSLLGAAHREKSAELPELSEIEIIRHFTRLSTWNYAIDLGLYPLGSCTMKYNPKVCEDVAALPGFADVHPYAPAALTQGALEVMYELEKALVELSGMSAITLLPAAGAHGELTGMPEVLGTQTPPTLWPGSVKQADAAAAPVAAAAPLCPVPTALM